jgi:hypothetical protein
MSTLVLALVGFGLGSDGNMPNSTEMAIGKV